MKRQWRKLCICAVVPLFLGTTACLIEGSRVATGELRTESRNVQLGGAKTAEVHLKMGAGKLTVDSGATDLMNAEFTYNVDRWKPRVTYDVSGTNGRLTVEQPSSGGHGGNTRYEWAVHLNRHVPMELNVDQGAGEANLNLVGLALSNLQMNIGAGETTINLDGPWKNDLTASVHGGVGRATIQLPRDVGVHVVAHGGLGAINASGFIKDGDAYTNAAYGKSPVTLRITVEGGVGEIDLQLGGGASGTV
jgi:N-terminal domain of toast_rack, DUF2154